MIEVTVKGKNIEVTDGLKAYAEKRLQKLERYLPNLRDAVVRECVERNLHRVEVTIEGDGITLRGEERSDDMYKSVDLVLDKLEQRARKFKERHSHSGHHDQSIRKNVMAHNDETFDGMLSVETIPDVDLRPTLTREKRVTMKPMTAEEAAQRMELTDHDFFLYLDCDSRQFNVIYKRKDGNYGLISPKV